MRSILTRMFESTVQRFNELCHKHNMTSAELIEFLINSIDGKVDQARYAELGRPAKNARPLINRRLARKCIQ
jgi:hypothetical protein